MRTGQAIFCLVLGLMYPAWERGSAGDWRFYTRSEFGIYQYDEGSVSYLSNHIVRLTQKLLLSDRGIADIVREIGEEYGEVKEIIIIREIDCALKRTHMLGLMYVSDKSGVIKRESYEPTEWDAITPDSVDAILHDAVCKQSEFDSNPIRFNLLREIETIDRGYEYKKDRVK